MQDFTINRTILFMGGSSPEHGDPPHVDEVRLLEIRSSRMCCMLSGQIQMLPKSEFKAIFLVGS